MKTINANGNTVLVDDEDLDRLSSTMWHLSNRGYVVRSEWLNGVRRCIQMHRRVLNLDKDDKRVVDHINGDQLDNRKENLRVCTHAQNLCNTKLYKNNKSGYKGVCWNKRKVAWTAQIYKNRKCFVLGSFDDPELAYAVYVAAADRIHGAFARAAFKPMGDN